MAWNEPGGGNQHDPWSGGGRRGDKDGGNRGGNDGGNRGGNNGGNNQGPPDLDEALKKFQDKLNGMLGGGGKKRAAVISEMAVGVNHATHSHCQAFWLSWH